MSVAGHLVGVTADRYGATLTADLAVGDTVLQVDSTTDFDEVEGGTVLVGGVKLDYVAFDDPDEDDSDDDGPTTLTLTAASTVAADEGDRVWAFDPTTGGDDPVTEYVALVTIDDRDEGDALPARIRAGLVAQVDSDFETYLGKAVELDVTDQGELVLVDILGSKATGKVQGYQDSHVATSPTDLSFDLTYQPLSGSTVHLYWNGIEQEDDAWSIDGWTITIDDPDSRAETDDRFYVKYLYTDPATKPVPPPIPASLTLVGSAHVTSGATGIAVPAATRAGDLLVLAIISRSSSACDCTDSRFTVSHAGLGPAGMPTTSIWVGYGFADGTLHAIPITMPAGLSSAARATLAVFRTTGSVSDAYTPLRSRDGDGGVFSPTIPAGDIGIAALVGENNVVTGPFSDDSTGQWTTVSPSGDSDNTSFSAVLIAYCLTGTPAGSWDSFDSGSGWGALTIALNEAPGV